MNQFKRAKINGIDLNEFKLGKDFVYEKDGMQSLIEITSEPVKDTTGGFTWEAINVDTEEVITFNYHPSFPEYKPNINKVISVK